MLKPIEGGWSGFLPIYKGGEVGAKRSRGLGGFFGACLETNRNYTLKR